MNPVVTRPNKKRSFRRIVVDGRAYQWSFHGVLCVVICATTSARGQRLFVDWGWMDHLDADYDASKQTGPQVIKPDFVRRAIEAGRELGWSPELPGTDFQMSFEGNRFVARKV